MPSIRHGALELDFPSEWEDCTTVLLARPPKNGVRPTFTANALHVPPKAKVDTVIAEQIAHLSKVLPGFKLLAKAKKKHGPHSGTQLEFQHEGAGTRLVQVQFLFGTDASSAGKQVWTFTLTDVPESLEAVRRAADELFGRAKLS